MVKMICDSATTEFFRSIDGDFYIHRVRLSGIGPTISADVRLEIRNQDVRCGYRTGQTYGFELKPY